MGFFSFLSSNSAARSKRRQRPEVNLGVESLEQRCLLSASSISTTINGFVYFDANSNGTIAGNEAIIPGVHIDLYNTTNGQNLWVASAVTDASGKYVFTKDATIDTSPMSLMRSVTFPNKLTNFTNTLPIGQFDPELGTLVSIEVQSDGTIFSNIKVENTSDESASLISGNVSGNFTLTGPGGLSLLNQPNNPNVGQFNATIFDGSEDFSGGSGSDFGTQSATATATTTLTGAALSAFTGTGTVNLTLKALATSSATGGGNVNVRITSSAQAAVRLIYNYIPNNNLKPGTYRVVETQPNGYIDGLESRGQVVIPNTIGTDFIDVQLTDTGSSNFLSTDNNFGERKLSSLSGHVYGDIGTAGNSGNYNNGHLDAGEHGIITYVTLTGTTDGGLDVPPMIAQTDGTGFYKFSNLLPGTYQLQETQAPGWLDGKDTIGTPGGSTSNDLFTNIHLPQAYDGINNDFGELFQSTLSGYVYGDTGAGGHTNNGVFDADESAIVGASVTLTGTNYAGQTITPVVATTNVNGWYYFTDLDPGTYTIRETQPNVWLDGKDTVGTPGGFTSNDTFSNIQLAAGYNGVNNNFGELLPIQQGTSSLSGYVYGDVGGGGNTNNGSFDPGESAIVGATVTLTGVTNQGVVIKPVSTTTDGSGRYYFGGLDAGTYALTESQPNGWLDGKDTIGTPGGTTGNDVFSTIQLPGGYNGVNNNFGELLPGQVVKAAGEIPFHLTPQFVPVQFLSKNQQFTTTGAGTLDPVMQAQGTYIDGLYRTLLARPATYQEMSVGVQQLQAGVPRSQIIAPLWNSLEHRLMEVNDFYTSYLHRTANAAEGMAWARFLQQTQNETLVAAYFLTSAEYIALNGNNSAGVIAGLYADTLGTDQLPLGATAYWQNVLAGNGNDYAAVAQTLLGNDMTTQRLVGAFYRQILGRAPGQSELLMWTTQVKTGQSPLFHVAELILSSDEFYSQAVRASR